MVCKNCGADLKPGIKYCVECGNYIDEEDEEEEVFEDIGLMVDDSQEIEFNEEEPKKKKKVKLRLTTMDYVIYAVLFTIFIGSILVLIFASR